MSQPKAFHFVLILALAFVTPPAGAKKPNPEKPKQSACSKPPALVSKGMLSKEDQEKAKKERMVDTVAFTIGEDGSVSTAHASRATSKTAGELLEHLVKSMKFKPRPGCGDYHTEVNFGPD